MPVLPAFSIAPLSERAALLSFGNVIDPEINGIINRLHTHLIQNNFDGFVESVPAYSSLALFYDPYKILQSHPEQSTAFGFVSAFIRFVCETGLGGAEAVMSRQLEIPVLYDGLDLETLADAKGISIHEAVRMHTDTLYRVYMIGFQPGFAYMGKVVDQLATPRRPTPRTTAPAGSVGIAGDQTGIYPRASPGGWQLIGRTPLKIFDPLLPAPCLFRSGDHVRFFSIDASEFEKLNEH